MNNNEFFELCINRGFSNIEITIYDNKEYVSEVENEKINFIDIKNTNNGYITVNIGDV